MKPKKLSEDQWIDSVLSQAGNIKNVSPKRNLLPDIEQRLRVKKQVKVLSIKQLGWVSIAASIIIVLNIYVLNQRNQSQTNDTTDTEQTSLVSDYSLYQ